MKRVIRPTIRVGKALRLAVPRVVMLVTLIAFSVQTYLTQTHIHMASEGRGALEQTLGGPAKALATAPSIPKDKYPANEDPANCPLCQEITHSGQFVTPAAALTLLPALSVSVIELVVAVPSVPRAVTHIWRGRGPPLH